ncbi:MAG: hypothetical protein RJA44_2570, partial [Pseudomonadota bacterium]
LGLLCAALTGFGAQAGDRLPFSSAASQGGIKAEFRLEGEQAGPIPLDQGMNLTLDLQDQTSGTPLRGLRPRMWVSRQTADPPESCEALIRRFASGRLSQRADRDLNSFQIVTLNADNSVSFINPLVSLNTTKLEALVPLPGSAGDWLPLPERDLLLVALPEQGKIAVIDTVRLRLRKLVELPGGRPGKLVAGQDGSRAWVLTEQPARAVELDLAKLEAGATLPLGPGPHAAALNADAGTLLVANSGDATLSLLDLRAQRLLGTTALPGLIRDVSYSALSNRYYAAARDGRIAVIEPGHGRIESTLAGPEGLAALRADPSGSFVLGVSPQSSSLIAIDTARQKIIGSASVPVAADQIGYTSRFAYLLGRDSTQISLIDLKQLGEGRISSSEVPVMQKPNREAGTGPAADLMVPSPEGDGMLIAGQADTALYYYTEGMMAPQGSYRTYSRASRAVTVIDRSLREVAPGRYASTLRLDRGGLYRIPLLVQNPRMVHCFDVRIDETGATSVGKHLDLQFDLGGPEAAALQAGREFEVLIRLRDAHSGEPVRGVRDLQIMAMELPGLSQQRHFARETATPGLYRLRLRLHNPGQWRLQAQSVSQGLSYERSPTTDLKLRPASADTAVQPAAAAPNGSK